MTTKAGSARGKSRWRLALVAAIVLCALAVIAVEVVTPLAAGLPIGWGQYNNAAYHLHVGAPPFWNVVGDSDLGQGSPNNCTFAVIASPLTEPAQASTLGAVKLPRSMTVFVAKPCAGLDADMSWQLPWQPTGQQVSVAGQSAPVEINRTPDIPQVSYAVGVALHGYHYTFLLQDPTAAQAQQDLPDFLTFARSFRYTS